MAKKQHSKTEQLQIRVSASQKLAIKKQAERAQMSVSQWVLRKLLPSHGEVVKELIAELADSSEPDYAFAELLERVDSMGASEFEEVFSELPEAPLSAYWQNYLAATVEHAAVLKNATVPAWTRDIAPLSKPVFGSSLESLKKHLLLNSPPPFSARNIFIDSNLGNRV